MLFLYPAEQKVISVDVSSGDYSCLRGAATLAVYLHSINISPQCLTFKILEGKINCFLLYVCTDISCHDDKSLVRALIVNKHVCSCFRIWCMHIKQKISQAVDDRFALISSDILYHMRMVSDNDVGAAIDELSSQALLIGIVCGLVFGSSMDRHYVDVSFSFIPLQSSTVS